MRWAALLLLAACGRIDFDPLRDANADNGLLGCGGMRGPIVDLADPSLLAFWSFNEGSLPAPDHGHSGASFVPALGVPQVAPGGIGDLLSVYGASAQVTATLPFAGAGLSLEGWFHLAQSQCDPMGVFLMYGWGFLLGCDAGGFPKFTYGNDVATATTRVDDFAWHHIVGTAGAGSVAIWIDGALAATAPLTTAIQDGTGNLQIGPLGLFIDELRVWRGALSPAAIATLAHAWLPGLQAYWSFDADYNGFAALPGGTAMGGISLAASGRAGGTATFDGIDGRVEAALPDYFSQSYTAMAWIRTTATGAIQQILDREPENDPRSPLHLWLDDTSLTANVRALDNTDFGGTAAVSLADNCWHHVALVREGADNQSGAVRLYADGAKVFETTGTFGTTADATDPFRIGYRLLRDPRDFAGRIDEVQVYNRALSDAEIFEIYATLQ